MFINIMDEHVCLSLHVDFVYSYLYLFGVLSSMNK